jgi:hypothetical protein
MLTYFNKAIEPKSGYSVGEAFTAKPHTAELFATVRDNGRILDDFQCVVGGHAVFEASLELGKVIEDPSISRSGPGTSISERACSQGCGPTSLDSYLHVTRYVVFDAQGAQIPPNEFLRRLTENDSDPLFASDRWLVVLEDNGRLVAQIQGLPGPAAVLNGRPALKRSVRFSFQVKIGQAQS